MQITQDQLLYLVANPDGRNRLDGAFVLATYVADDAEMSGVLDVLETPTRVRVFLRSFDGHVIDILSQVRPPKYAVLIEPELTVDDEAFIQNMLGIDEPLVSEPFEDWDETKPETKITYSGCSLDEVFGGEHQAGIVLDVVCNADYRLRAGEKMDAVRAELTIEVTW